MTLDISRLENRVAHLERRTDRLDVQHQEYVNWLSRIDARITSLSRELGSKFAELLGAIDSVSKRSKSNSRNYSTDDAEEITAITDYGTLKDKAREQRDMIVHIRSLTRVLKLLLPVVTVLGAAAWELLRFLLSR